jgi:hypothetical protein
MYKVQRFGVCQSPHIPDGVPSAVSKLNRQCGADLDVKHDSTSVVGTPVLITFDRYSAADSSETIIRANILANVGITFPAAFEPAWQ